VSRVPAGSTVLVCPGIYAEQVVISKPLTLAGTSNGSSAQAVIAVPSGGLSATSSLLGTLSPQVLVEATSGPVNITNITVDGTAFVANSCATILAGVYYDLNSSGTLFDLMLMKMHTDCKRVYEIATAGSTTGIPDFALPTIRLTAEFA